tara:strand:- start:219 stop:599 length:381 start_codon:yes stop_codon:yes gene_type:complete
MTSLQVMLDKNNIEIKQEEQEKKLIKTLNELSEIQANISDLLLQQDERINRIENNVDYSEDKIKLALDDLAECDKMYFSYKPVVLGTVLGGAICSPLVTLVGIKYLGISTSVGGLLGGLAGYKIQK